MTEERKRYPNSGILGRNKSADENPNFAPYSGHGEIDCPHCKKTIEFWLKAWVKDGRTGKFFGLKFDPKDSERKQRGPQHGPRPTNQRELPGTTTPGGDARDPADDVRF